MPGLVDLELGVVGFFVLSVLGTSILLSPSTEHRRQHMPHEVGLAEIAEDDHIELAIVYLGVGGERHRISPVRAVCNQHDQRTGPDGTVVEYDGNAAGSEGEASAHGVEQA